MGRTYECVWVVCPDCDVGRYVRLVATRRPGYTGRCKLCYLRVAKSAGWSSGRDAQRRYEQES